MCGHIHTNIDAQMIDIHIYIHYFRRYILCVTNLKHVSTELDDVSTIIAIDDV